MSKQFQIVALALSGENTPEGRTKSIIAYTEFKKLHTLGNIGGSQMTYTDDKGFIVFCSVLLVGPEYVVGFYTRSWEKVCTQFELDPPTGYETVLDFQTALFGYYQESR